MKPGNMPSRLSFALSGLLSLAAMTGGCAEMTLGDISLQQAFDDPRTIALIEAACAGDEKRVHELIQTGADVNAEGNDDMRPLPWVMQCGNLVGLEALLEAGADPNYLYKGHTSAIALAVSAYDVEMVKVLIRHGADLDRWEAGENLLSRAMGRGIETGNWENYYALLDAGADIENADAGGATLMTSAIAWGQFDKASELLDRGYDRALPEVYSSALSRFVNESMPHYRHKQAFLRKLDAMGVQPARTSG